MLSQFTKDGKRPLLGELAHFDTDIYPVGRLDGDSEGLLILTNNKALNNALLKPVNAHKRVYYAQVDRMVTPEALAQLEAGMHISVEGKAYHTLPAKAQCIEPPDLPERHPPVRYRKDIPTSWLRLELTEGKNRQVRRMTAGVGFPTLRLVRYAIEGLNIDGMYAGEVSEIDEGSLLEKLQISL
jgi:23S rRNA pseudouridine2457 synthase